MPKLSPMNVVRAGSTGRAFNNPVASFPTASMFQATVHGTGSLNTGVVRVEAFDQSTISTLEPGMASQITFASWWNRSPASVPPSPCVMTNVGCEVTNGRSGRWRIRARDVFVGGSITTQGLLSEALAQAGPSMTVIARIVNKHTIDVVLHTNWMRASIVVSPEAVRFRRLFSGAAAIAATTAEKLKFPAEIGKILKMARIRKCSARLRSGCCLTL